LTLIHGSLTKCASIGQIRRNISVGMNSSCSRTHYITKSSSFVNQQRAQNDMNLSNDRLLLQFETAAFFVRSWSNPRANKESTETAIEKKINTQYGYIKFE
jgi:hypothetical protein